MKKRTLPTEILVQLDLKPGHLFRVNTRDKGNNGLCVSEVSKVPKRKGKARP